METENIGVKELDELCLHVLNEDAIIKEEKARLSQRTKELEKVKAKVIATLTALEKKTYPVGGAKITVRETFTYNTPRGEDAIKFFDWCLKTQGEIYVKNTFKMHSRTLQSFANEQIENALAKGDVEFKIDGLGEKKLLQTLSIRRS